MMARNEALLKNLAAQIKTADKAPEECLEQDAALRQKANGILSIPGVGLQTAVYVLIASKGMQSFDSPRQFACYGGRAPFPHPSGVSVHGGNKVPFTANRKMKSLLHMAALNAVTFDDELKSCYKRKVEEGKNPMSVINAVRLKLICGLFAVVKRAEAFKLDCQRIAA